MSRLMTDGEICANFRQTVGTEPAKLKRLRELNPGLTKSELIGILNSGGIEVKQRVAKNRPRYVTTPEQREALRAENEERLKQGRYERERIVDWAKRIGIGSGTLALILNTTEEDYDSKVTDNRVNRCG